MRLVLAALLAATAVPATAVTFDAFGSFTGANPGGAFSYGSFDESTVGFTPFTGDTGCSNKISNVTCLGDLPGAFKTTSGAHQSGTVIVPGDALILHPGPNAGQSSAVVFTAPKAGVYKLAFSAFVADNNPSGVQIEAFIPGAILQSLATLTAANPTYSITTPFTFTAGEKVGFAVNYDGIYYNDSTGVNYTLTSVPEPASWALMIVGFGMVGAAARRRGRALTA